MMSEKLEIATTTNLLRLHALGLRAYADAVLAATGEAKNADVCATATPDVPVQTQKTEEAPPSATLQSSSSSAEEAPPSSVVESAKPGAPSAVVATAAAPAAPGGLVFPDLSGDVADVVAGMQRPALVRYIEERPHLLAHPAFSVLGGSLDGKHAKTIRLALVAAYTSGVTSLPEVAAASRQIPDTGATAQTLSRPMHKITDTPATVLPTNDITDTTWDWGADGTNLPPFQIDDMHPDIAADVELRKKAEELMASTQMWRAADMQENPGVEGPMTSFFKGNKCAGVCVLHSRAQVLQCLAALSDSSAA